MGKLYDIAGDYAKLMNEDLDPEMIADTLDAIEGEFEDKVESMIKMIKEQKMLSDALKVESKIMADRAKAINNAIENTKQYMITSMQAMDKKSINAGLHKLTIRKPSQTIEIEDADKLPPEFVDYKTEVIPDKNKIKAEIKAGASIEGAKLVNGKSSLIIK